MTVSTRHRRHRLRVNPNGAKRPRRTHRLFVAGVFLISSAGCLGPTSWAGRDSDASVSVLRGEIRELIAAVAVIRTDMHAGRDVNENDKWTMRLLGLGVLMLGLSYPIGKIVWIATSAAARRAGLHATAQEGRPTMNGDDYLPFREGLARRCEIMTRA